MRLLVISQVPAHVKDLHYEVELGYIMTHHQNNALGNWSLVISTKLESSSYQKVGDISVATVNDSMEKTSDISMATVDNSMKEICNDIEVNLSIIIMFNFIKLLFWQLIGALPTVNSDSDAESKTTPSCLEVSITTNVCEYNTLYLIIILC